jgi:hypothetical protein
MKKRLDAGVEDGNGIVVCRRNNQLRNFSTGGGCDGLPPICWWRGPMKRFSGALLDLMQTMDVLILR